MTTAKKLYLILLIAAVAVVLWYAVSLSKNQVQPGNNKPVEVATTTDEVNNATSTEPVVVATSTKDWLTYRNEEYGFELKYPANFIKTTLIGEFYKGEEYPKLGVSFGDPGTKTGSFEEVRVYVYDKGYVDFGVDLSNTNIFDFKLKKVENLQDLKNYKELENSEILKINGLDYLSMKKNNRLGYILQNPQNKKFIELETLNVDASGNYIMEKLNIRRKNLLNQVLLTIIFYE